MRWINAINYSTRCCSAIWSIRSFLIYFFFSSIGIIRFVKTDVQGISSVVRSRCELLKDYDVKRNARTGIQSENKNVGLSVEPSSHYVLTALVHF